MTYQQTEAKTHSRNTINFSLKTFLKSYEKPSSLTNHIPLEFPFISGFLYTVVAPETKHFLFLHVFLQLSFAGKPLEDRTVVCLQSEIMPPPGRHRHTLSWAVGGLLHGGLVGVLSPTACGFIEVMVLLHLCHLPFGQLDTLLRTH